MNHELTAASVPNAGDPVLAHSPHLRTRVLWTAVALLALLLLVVTPPLLKLNRYARGIAFSMSQSLGRPVHLDNVSLGLFPVPHLTLQNVVVSEDPAFGREPIIRANTVEANLRASSLWRRPMEFSRVRFVEPSVNLVRDAGGHWNLEGVLVHASQVDTAPTIQQHRGTAPRFPYIEATGGRVNIKIGEEKKPFSLVDTDFALWLPSPEQWSIRFTGTPARTDTNLNDPGILRLEGSLRRAAHMGQVPVTLQATWRNAPLGEATRLLTGDDQGWRGTVQVDASIRGSLGASRLGTDITFDDLRRADFVPVRTLSLHLHCVALADVTAATLQDLSCDLPAGDTQPLRLQAEHVDLSHPLAAGATMEAEKAPLEWFASWARLFSRRFPPTALPGTLDATLTRDETPSASQAASDSQATSLRLGNSGPFLTPSFSNSLVSASPQAAAGHTRAAVLSGWIGSVTLHLPLPPEPVPDPLSTPATPIAPAATGPAQVGHKATSAAAQANRASALASPTSVAEVADQGQSVTAEIAPGPAGDSWHVTLPPSPVRLSADSVLSFYGTATPAGYSLHAAGQASPATLLRFARELPPLGDGLPAALATPLPTPLPLTLPADTPVHLDLTCARGWSAATGDQTCTRTPSPTRKPVAKPRR